MNGNFKGLWQVTHLRQVCVVINMGLGGAQWVDGLDHELLFEVETLERKNFEINKREKWDEEGPLRGSCWKNEMGFAIH